MSAVGQKQTSEPAEQLWSCSALRVTERGCRARTALKCVVKPPRHQDPPTPLPRGLVRRRSAYRPGSNPPRKSRAAENAGALLKRLQPR
jgi:hypothetical protein